MKTKRKIMTPTDIITTRYYMSKELKPYNKRSIIRTIIGSVFIIYGFATILLPTFSVFFIGIGCSMVGYDFRSIYQRIKYEVNLRKIMLL